MRREFLAQDPLQTTRRRALVQPDQEVRPKETPEAKHAEVEILAHGVGAHLSAVLASRESGGRLNETVERISKSVLELQRLERKIRSETAQARKSSVYMVLVTPVILGAFFLLDPDAVVNLFTSPIGQLVLCAAFVLNMVAYFWALKILNTDI